MTKRQKRLAICWGVTLSLAALTILMTFSVRGVAAQELYHLPPSSLMLPPSPPIWPPNMLQPPAFNGRHTPQELYHLPPSSLMLPPSPPIWPPDMLQPPAFNGWHTPRAMIQNPAPSAMERWLDRRQTPRATPLSTRFIERTLDKIISDSLRPAPVFSGINMREHRENEWHIHRMNKAVGDKMEKDYLLRCAPYNRGCAQRLYGGR